MHGEGPVMPLQAHGGAYMRLVNFNSKVVAATIHVIAGRKEAPVVGKYPPP